MAAEAADIDGGVPIVPIVSPVPPPLIPPVFGAVPLLVYPLVVVVLELPASGGGSDGVIVVAVVVG